MVYSYFNSASGTTNELWLHKTEVQTIIHIQKQNLSNLQSLEKDNRVFENTLIFF